MSNDDENRKQSKPREGALHSLPKGMSLVTYILQCKSTFNVAVSKTDEIKGASAVQCKTRNAAARPHSQHQPGAERRDRRRWRHQKRPSMRGGGVNAVGERERQTDRERECVCVCERERECVCVCSPLIAPNMLPLSPTKTPPSAADVRRCERMSVRNGRRRSANAPQ